MIRSSTALRLALLAGSALALQMQELVVAVGLAVLTVAVGTPAYPAAAWRTCRVSLGIARHGSPVSWSPLKSVPSSSVRHWAACWWQLAAKRGRPRQVR